ncbi:hypothetical protein O1611_g9139 [Lasiodiplodia mahajangana]|uniref:Uncharacterized protein n=1 Tax=Lasiodiplodia mahajangana TaxID=1108764 RepID=A0ACC2JAS9_9PEZI|nr:hypothetical protein O1611_g9139 [Lasiodiplodia mahajangana]
MPPVRKVGFDMRVLRYHEGEEDQQTYIDEDDDLHASNDHEDFIRPGGLVRLNETDETPRYLGPSSGIAMTRIVMEEAKRYTDTGRISELIPNVKGRRKATGAGVPPGNRSQSFSMPAMNPRKKSYPMISAVPASNLPSRVIADKLIEVFHQRAQVFTPAIHEKILGDALEDVYAGSQDPYQNFVLLPRSDAVLRGRRSAEGPQDAPVSRADRPILATNTDANGRILCSRARDEDQPAAQPRRREDDQHGRRERPLTLDLRRRLSWITDDIVDIKWFETVPDANITENGIIPGPPDERKLVAIHFCKMRLLQAEIRRTLYEMKRPEPRNAHHPWFADMEAKMEQWLRSSPEKPPWCKPWQISYNGSDPSPPFATSAAAIGQIRHQVLQLGRVRNRHLKQADDGGCRRHNMGVPTNSIHVA